MSYVSGYMTYIVGSGYMFNGGSKVSIYGSGFLCPPGCLSTAIDFKKYLQSETITGAICIYKRQMESTYNLKKKLK